MYSNAYLYVVGWGLVAYSLNKNVQNKCTIRERTRIIVFSYFQILKKFYEKVIRYVQCTYTSSYALYYANPIYYTNIQILQ